MLYRRCGRGGLKLPVISLGLWQSLGDDHPLANGRALLRRAFDLGITHFDLGNNYGAPYGSAEINFGRILAEDFGPYREELIISTKAGYDMWPGPYGEWGSRKYLLSSLDHSLRRMGLDYVDIFYSHRFDPATLSKKRECARQRGAAGEGTLRRDLKLRSGSQRAGGVDLAKAGYSAADSSALLLAVQSLGRGPPPGCAGEQGRGLHHLLAARSGPFDR
jgi:aryl-alcohol dehydrogenase-like predicted oxidoreductase